ncbi:phytoene desaturase family protein [Halobacteria archaeon HArc-gm2]|nr:phytoene desaturase family protein [Halobacteria archaeon HArc-gm2]
MAAGSDAEVVVVGAGFGGLSTACYLADAGLDVTVVEKNESLGGRASVLERDGFRFDMGPSWYMMPDVFERFFGHFDREHTEFYELTRLDPHYRVFFKDGEEGTGSTGPGAGPAQRGVDQVDVTPDRAAMRRLFESYEPGAGAALDSYLEQAAETYEVGMEQFVYTDRGSFRDYLDWDVLRNARGLGLLGSMQDHVSDYFDHPKLQQLVQYSLVFLGGSPTNTPALYNLMSHVDFELGVHYPEAVGDFSPPNRETVSPGGMGTVVDVMAALGAEMGVTYRTGVEVDRITGERGNFTLETSQGPVTADLVVSDADYAHTEKHLLAPEDRQFDDDYWDSRTYAPSAFLLYLGVEGDVDPLEHHTLVLPEDWTDHFEKIFDDPSWPDDPAYYCCVPSETDPTVAPEGHSNLFVLVPIAPGLEDGPEAREAARDALLDDLAENVGVDLRDRIVVEEQFTVSEFADRYNAEQGSALGLAHTLRQTGPLRPDHRSSALDGLYFTGGFTRPGIGVPMCLISGEHAASAVLADLDGDRRIQRPA